MSQHIQPTEHERAEWSRAAHAMYARGRSDLGHVLSAAAAIKPLTLAQFDRAATAYRAWLVFDEPQRQQQADEAALGG